MKGFEGIEFFAVKERLNQVVHSIVERHRTAGRVLTWRLVHEIEKEALHTLEKAGDLDRQYIRMMRSSRWGYIPRVDEPAELVCGTALPDAVAMIRQAYQMSH